MFLVDPERKSKGVVRSFNNNGWRQKRILELGVSTAKILFLYYRRRDLVEDLKMIEFSIKENPEVREIVYCSFQ